MARKIKELERALEILRQITSDPGVPRNIKTKCQEALDALEDEKFELHIRINKAISFLDEISEDPNVPLHVRTMIWETASLLETASTKVKIK